MKAVTTVAERRRADDTSDARLRPGVPDAAAPARRGDAACGYVGSRRRQPGRGGSRRAGPGGLRRAGRLRELVGTGLADSLGMSLGWTVLILLGSARGGIAEAALYNQAMLIGVVLSAPVTGWLARRVGGRALLRGAAGIELVLRVGLLLGLIAGLPTWVIAAGIAIMSIAAWTGFAAMRAEVSAVDPRPRAMTRYALAVAAVEAVGTGVGALLPVGPDGHPTGGLLIAVLVLYGGSLLPTIVSARRARVTPAAKPSTVTAAVGGQPAGGHVDRRVADRRGEASRADIRRVGDRRAQDRAGKVVAAPASLAAGGMIMLLASGPTLLAVPLITELHGRAWVAGAAVAFSLGCLLSSTAVEVVGRLRFPPMVRWSLWGLAMLAGWSFAAVSPVAVLAAQFLCGMALTAFEGDMDARVAERAPASGVTAALAYSAATRATGGAVAVRMLPMLVAASTVGTVVTTAGILLATAALALWATASLRRTGRTLPAA